MTRKTKTVLISVCLLLTVTVVYAFAAAGGSSDPLASLSYLTGTFTDAVDQQVEEKLDASDQAILDGDTDLTGGTAATWTETRLKEADTLTGSTGTGVLVLTPTQIDALRDEVQRSGEETGKGSRAGGKVPVGAAGKAGRNDGPPGI